MMGRWTIRETGMVVIAFLLSLSIAYCVGGKNKEQELKLAQNKTAIVSSDSVTKLVTRAVDSARRRDSVLDKKYDVVRTRVRVERDTVTVMLDSAYRVYVNATLAELIVSADSTIAAQKHSLALQDTLIADLHRSLTLRDERINLLEKRTGPRFGLKTGMAVGAVGSVALVVVAVKVIQAIHK